MSLFASDAGNSYGVSIHQDYGIIIVIRQKGLYQDHYLLIFIPDNFCPGVWNSEFFQDEKSDF
jgi:hypothetical protein